MGGEGSGQVGQVGVRGVARLSSGGEGSGLKKGNTKAYITHIRYVRYTILHNLTLIDIIILNK